MQIIDVIIPALNEEQAIGKVLADLPSDKLREIIVCDNASIDDTASIARKAGATVLTEERKGYGHSCLRAMNHIADKTIPPDIVVFLDGDYSDHPEQLPHLTKPITEGRADLVIGSRALGRIEQGAMTPHQIFGNWLATCLIKLFYGYNFTDLGPFRAIRYESLLQLQMEDTTYGWTAEMQVKAAKYGLICTEVPVDYRRRIGQSKVSGTLKGTVLAGHKILWTIFKYI